MKEGGHRPTFLLRFKLHRKSRRTSGSGDGQRLHEQRRLTQPPSSFTRGFDETPRNSLTLVRKWDLPCRKYEGTTSASALSSRAHAKELATADSCRQKFELLSVPRRSSTFTSITHG